MFNQKKKHMKNGKFEKTALEAQAQLGNLIDYIRDESMNEQAHQVEKHIFLELLKIGLVLLKSYFEQLQQKDWGRSLFNINGLAFKRGNKTTRTYYSIFGKLKLTRQTYRRAGHQHIAPLDAHCNLPRGIYSHFLQEIGNSLCMNDTFKNSSSNLERLFGLNIRPKQLEQITRQQTDDVEEFYPQKPLPSTQTEGEIQVLSFDGKGVPVTKRDGAAIKPRPGKGEKRQKKKEALVAVSYTVNRKQRTAEQIARKLIYPEQFGKDEPRSVRAQNVLKIASLKQPKLATIQQAQQDAVLRNSQNTRPTAVLIDGQLWLQTLVEKGLDEIDDYVVILDIIHVITYLYNAAHVFHQENSREAKQYVHKQLVKILQGNVGRVIGSMRQSLTKQDLSNNKSKALKKVIVYLDNHRSIMHYHEYLKEGFPIGTGVVESACKSVVKCRMEGSGMRWSIDGAEAMIQLRAVYTSHYWDDYLDFHSDTQHNKLYGDFPSVMKYSNAA